MPFRIIKIYRLVIKTKESTRRVQVPPSGKAIRQVASPSSLCQRFPYVPFNAMVTKISK